MKKLALALLLTFAVVAAVFAQTPGIKVDDNTMDFQSWYGNLPRMIHIDPVTGETALAYTWSSDSVNADYTMPHVRYKNLTDGTTTDVKADFGETCVDKLPDGRYMIFANSKHIPWFTFGGWGTGATLFEESAVGSAQFDSLYWFDENPIAGPNNVLNTDMAISAEGVIHLLLYDGWGDAVLY